MRGIGAGVRIFDLLERKPVIDPEVGVEIDRNRRGPIRFEKVSFRYPSRPTVEVLKELDLEINVGDSIAIVYVLAHRVETVLTDHCSQWWQRQRKVVDDCLTAQVLRSNTRESYV